VAVICEYDQTHGVASQQIREIILSINHGNRDGSKYQ
jgi:hypothetical protein